MRSARSSVFALSQHQNKQFLIALHFGRVDLGMICREEDEAIPAYCKDDEWQSARKMPPKAGSRCSLTAYDLGKGRGSVPLLFPFGLERGGALRLSPFRVEIYIYA